MANIYDRDGYTSRLDFWKDKLYQNDAAYATQREAMDRREAQYRGERELRPVIKDDPITEAVHVRNITFELIESQISTIIPQPKVTARYERDTAKAKLIEDMIRNELDRLPMEQLNDMMERTVPIQGGAFWLVEWDDSQRGNTTIGEVTVTTVHPKQIVPQDGVFTAVEDMDFIILKMPQTKEYIRRRYGVDVDNESESESDIKSTTQTSTADDVVTQYIVFYRNDDGGIGVYSWVNDTELEDIEDYQARRMRVCAKCGTPDHASGDGETCPFCGGRMTSKEMDEETLWRPITRTDGTTIGGVDPMTGKPMTVPFYKPDMFPVILQRSVSVFGQLLGDSDVDKIADQQNTTNRIEAKIISRLLMAGTRVTLPARADMELSPDDFVSWRSKDPSEIARIKSFDFKGDLSFELQYLSQVYEEARQELGITDSFQGRRDTTATSRVAKEFSAQQSAGRLESKRVLKNAAWASLFESIFKFKLAYADEPRPVISQSPDGTATYSEFNRYDFLERDEAGQWYYNDDFLFSCDTSSPLANNREAMWQETRLNYQTGAYGNPQAPETLILFWSRMEQLSYPGAAETKRYLEEQMQIQQQQIMAQQQMMQAQAEAQQRQLNAEAQAQKLDELSRAAAKEISKLGTQGSKALQAVTL